jgi:hypothetical protein
MSIYLIEKIPGGARIQRDSDDIISIHAFERPQITITTNELRFVLTSVCYYIRTTDTLMCDESEIGGSLHTYNPNTLTLKQMHSRILNNFNPFANLLTA